MGGKSTETPAPTEAAQPMTFQEVQGNGAICRYLFCSLDSDADNPFLDSPWRIQRPGKKFATVIEAKKIVVVFHVV